MGIVAVALGCASAAYGQTPDVKAFERPAPASQPPDARSSIDIAPATASRLAAPPAEDSGVKFQLSAVRLTGNTAIATSELEDSYSSFINRTVSESDLTTITDAITKIYLDAGYFLSRAYVPAQNVENGMLEIRIAEGGMSDVSFRIADGDTALAERLRVYADAIKDEQPLRLATLERQLMLIAQIPSIAVDNVTIDEENEFSGRFKLSMDVALQLFAVQVTADTYGTRDVGRLQASATAQLYGVWGQRDSIGLTLGGVPHDPHEWSHGTISYDVTPLPGFWLGARATYGELHPGGGSAIVGTREAYTDFAVSAGYVLSIARTHLWRVDGRFSAGNTDEDDDTGPLKRDRVRTVGLSTTAFHALPGGGVLTGLVDLEQGIDGLGSSQSGDPFLSRGDAEPDFLKLQGGLDWTQPLLGPLSLAVSTAGQITSAPVLSSREFYLGGARFGRGYEPGALSGDGGVAAWAELRYTREVNLGFLTGLQFYGYYDIGTVWDKGIAGRTSLASAGGGLRLYFADDLQVGVEVGVPLTYSEYIDGSHPARANLSISKAF